MRAVPVIAAYALRESLRRRVFLVVAVLTLGFLGLYSFGAYKLFDAADTMNTPAGISAEEVIGSTLFGLAMFATLFLGTVLSVFLTLGAIRGDAERGLLQPLVVRPVGRAAFLLARFLGGASVGAVYAVTVYVASLGLTALAGGWWPDRIAAPALELAAGVATLTALSLLGSVFLSATANGIAVFMLFGAGLVAGVLGQIGKALDSHTLRTIARITSWAVPYEALYQDALHRITLDTTGLTEWVLQLGPFGGAELGGRWLPLWAAAYLGGVLGLAVWGFARRDL